MRPIRMSFLLALLVLASCGGNKEPAMPSSWADFDCKGRKVAYFVVGGMAADEAGVTIDCATQGPRVLRWAVEKDGTRTEDSGNITPGEFDDLWKRIEGTGWRHLGDCPPDVDGDVPVYTFDVADHDGAVTFQCDALRPTFPWNTLIDELDQFAATIQGDAGKNTIDVEDEGLKPQQ
jgi:hypothetical protein